MFRKIPLILISISLILFCIVPTQVSAQETQDAYWPLKEKETENLLDLIRKKPLTEANFNLFNDALLNRPNVARETGAVVLVKQAVLKEQLDYWFKEVPKQLSIKFLKVSLKLVRIIYAQDIGSVIEIIEQVTVQEATNYAVNWFVQNDIKVGAGEANYLFDSYKGAPQKLNIQYIIVYHPTEDKTHGKIAAEFYSKDPIEPPMGTDPNAFARGIDNPKSLPWPWDRWIENEKQRDNDGKLEPFIVRVKGFVKRNENRVFSWDETKEPPTVEVDFDKPVPEIEVPPEYLEKPSILVKAKRIIEIVEKELARIQEKFAPPKVKRRTKDAWETSKDFFQEIGEELKETARNLIEKLGKYFGGVKPEAQIIGLEDDIRRSDLVTTDLEKLTEEALSLEEIGEELKEKIVLEEIPEKKTKSTLEKLIERFDEISERVEILLAQAEEFLPREKVSQEESKSQQSQEFESKETEEKEKKEEIDEKEKIDSEEEKRIDKEEKISQKEIVFCSALGTQSPIRNSIVFNEITWMGTTNSANDEWIELKNISGSSIDLTGWQILDKDKQIKIKFLDEDQSVILSPGGFLLLERTDDNSVPGIPADLIYTGSLSNTNEALYLFDENCNLQDKVEANPYWPAGSNSSKKTMERKTNLGWQTSIYVDGTPKAENSSGETVSGGGGATPPSSEQPTEQPSPKCFPILINEIMYNLEGNDEGREWIEIFNATDTEVDLTDWKFCEAETNHNLNLVQGTSSLSAAEYAVIANDSDEFLKDYPNYSGTLFDSSFSLNNTGESLSLKNKDLVCDQLAYSSNWGANGDGNSLQKIDPTATSNEPTNWKPAPPTPGQANSFPEENQLPVATFTYFPQNPQVNQEILFNAASSTDPDGQIISFTWDFGDGNSATTIQATTTHSFSTSSQFQITLVVSDDKGATSSTSTAIQVVEKQEPKVAQSVIISEVQIQKEEFVELYNPVSEPDSTNGWYLCAYSQNNQWNDPKICWEFPTSTVIEANKHYLIGVSNYPTSTESGYPQADWTLLTKSGHPYKQGQLADKGGAIGIFKCNPSVSTTTKSCKIDLFSWKKDGSTSTKVYEGTPFSFKKSDIEEKSFRRKKNQNEKYIDSDNNSTDFEIDFPTPTNSKGETGNLQSPGKVENFQIATSSDNQVILTWSTSSDPDTPSSSISYIIYYSKVQPITTNTLSTSTTASATTTTTNLTLQDLYYDSTYYFGIRAFDGLNWSELSTTTPLFIAPEIPQWQMFGYNSQRTFRSPYQGPTTSTIKWQFNATEAGVSQFWTGTAIDQNGTIYIGTTDGLVALTENGILKWHYSTASGRVLQPPMIGKDGTVYIITLGNKILALSPAGELKWQKTINTSFSSNSTIYHNVNLAISNNTLYYAAPQQIGTNTQPFLIAINSDNGNVIWAFALTQENTTDPASSPVISQDGTIYISFDKTLFAFSSQGNLKWQKEFNLHPNCQGNYPNSIFSLTSNDGTIYFLLKGAHHIQTSWCSYCADRLYAIDPDSINPATTTLSGGEIKWQQNLGTGKTFVLIGQNNLYLKTIFEGGMNCESNHYLYSFYKTGQLLSSTSSLATTLRLIDSDENLFGNSGNSATRIIGLNSGGNEIWQYYGGGYPNYFIFPFALAEDSTLYAPTSATLFAIGK